MATSTLTYGEGMTTLQNAFKRCFNLPGKMSRARCEMSLRDMLATVGVNDEANICAIGTLIGKMAPLAVWKTAMMQCDVEFPKYKHSPADRKISFRHWIVSALDLFKIVKSFRTLQHEVGEEQSLVSVVDARTVHLNKGGLFLPPSVLEPFTTLARDIIKRHVNVTRFYKDVLIDAAAAVNSDPELCYLWDTWYGTFNPGEVVYGTVIRCALLSKLINSILGGVIKEVNDRYTTIAKNKKMRFTLREELKVVSSNLSGGGASSSAFHPFNSVIGGVQNVGVVVVEGGEDGVPMDDDLIVDLDEVDYGAMLDEYEREMYGSDFLSQIAAEGEAAGAADGDNEADGEEELEGTAVWVEFARSGIEKGLF